MNAIYLWFQNNLDVVFFIYGLSFLIMGIIILVQPKEKSEFKIANILWLLAAFGITHGFNELLDMWAVIKNRHFSLDLFRWFIFIISYIFLFEFGKQLFYIATAKSPTRHKNSAKLLFVWLSPIIGLFVFTFSLMASDPWSAGTILGRYLLGVPGGILTAFGFLLYYKYEKKLLEPLKVKKHFYFAGLAFLIYGVLGGTVVPKGNFFPSNWLNTESFFSTVKIPVQAFRAICAITAAWAISGILDIFNVEVKSRLQKAQKMLIEQLKESEERYMEVVENSTDMIYSLDADGFIGSANRNGYQVLGFSKAELIGKHIKELYAPEIWKDLDTAIEKLKQGGVFFINECKMIKKDGKKLDVGVHLMALYDNKRNFYGMRFTARDISMLKLVEETLKKERDRAQKYLDVAAVIIKVLGADQKVALMNKKGCELLGYKEEEIIGKNWFDIFTPEKGRDEAKEFFKKLIAKEINPPEYFESLVLTKSGEEKTLVWRLTLLKDNEDNVTGTLGSGIDVTEQRKKEAEYKTIIETAMDGFLITDTKGKLLDVNKSYANLMGHTRDELLKMSIKDVEASESEEEIAQHAQKVIETGYDRFETKHICKNGSIVDIEVSTNYLDIDSGRFFVFLRDITERKKAEKEILLAKEEWEKTFNTINDMIFVCDRDLNIIKANKVAVDLLGMPRDGTGKKVKCYEYFFHEKDIPIEKCPAIKHFTTGKPVVHEMFEPRLNKVLEIRVIPRFENAQIAGFINIVRDITVQRKIVEELIRTQKLSSLGKMMAGISHEIKNPLAGIGLILKALSYDFNERHSGYKDIMSILKEINRLEDLLDNLMKFSKPKPLILEEMDISMPLENSLHILNRAIKDKEIKIKKDYHHNGLKIFIDPERIKQVFINLILNAIEAMDKNGVLDINIYEIINSRIHGIETVYSDLSKYISEITGSGIKVVIKDSGHGIKKENLGRVFDPFYSSKENKAGLGLYVTHEIIRQHKGQIYVESMEGRGTTFSIVLPHSPEVYS